MEGLIIGVPISFTKTKQFKSFMKRLVAVNGSLLRFTDTVNLIHHIQSLQSAFDCLGCVDELRPGASWGDEENEVIKKASKASKQGGKDALSGIPEADVLRDQQVSNGASRAIGVEPSNVQLLGHGDVIGKR